MLQENSPLELVCIAILGELIRTHLVNRYILVIAHRFTKLLKTILRKSIHSAETAKQFVNNAILNYGPLVDLLADNGKPFTAKFFLDLCRTVKVNDITTTLHHHQTSAEVETYNQTIIL